MDYKCEDRITIAQLKRTVKRLGYCQSQANKQGDHNLESHYKDRIFELESIIEKIGGEDE